MSQSDSADTIVRFRMWVNRADLERNGVVPPEQWEPAEALEADGLGLIYDLEVTTDVAVGRSEPPADARGIDPYGMDGYVG